jgi:hypothetical protein
MPKYLVQRVWDPMDEDELAKITLRSKQVLDDSFEDLTWERSQIAVDGDDVIHTFCIYGAPAEHRIREHSAIVGCHRIENIYELAGSVGPSDFPS